MVTSCCQSPAAGNWQWHMMLHRMTLRLPSSAYTCTQSCQQTSQWDALPARTAAAVICNLRVLFSPGAAAIPKCSPIISTGIVIMFQVLLVRPLK